MWKPNVRQFVWFIMIKIPFFFSLLFYLNYEIYFHKIRCTDREYLTISQNLTQRVRVYAMLEVVVNQINNVVLIQFTKQSNSSNGDCIRGFSISPFPRKTACYEIIQNKYFIKNINFMYVYTNNICQMYTTFIFNSGSGQCIHAPYIPTISNAWSTNYYWCNWMYCIRLDFMKVVFFCIW